MGIIEEMLGIPNRRPRRKRGLSIIESIKDPKPRVPKRYTPGEGAREIPIERALGLLQQPVRVALMKYPNLRMDFDEEDLKQSILSHWLKTNYLALFRPFRPAETPEEITPERVEKRERFFISVGVRNWVVTTASLARYRHRWYSGDQIVKVGDEGIITRFEALSPRELAKLQDDPVELRLENEEQRRINLRKILSLLDHTKERKAGQYTCEGISVRFTERQVFAMYLAGMSKTAIAVVFSVHPPCISRIVNDAYAKVEASLGEAEAA